MNVSTLATDIRAQRLTQFEALCVDLITSLTQEEPNRHLDYGCGDGRHTCILEEHLKHTHVLGYDINPASANSARRRAGLDFVAGDRSVLLPYVMQGLFDTSTCMFVLHESEDPLADLKVMKNITRNGIWIIEHDIQGITLEEFSQLFGSGPERVERDRLGLEEAYHLHTRRGLNEYVRMADRAELTTHQTWRTDHYCMMKCTRQQDT